MFLLGLIHKSSKVQSLGIIKVTFIYNQQKKKTHTHLIESKINKQHTQETLENTWK